MEPLPAQVWVRITNADTDDYDKVGVIVGHADMQIGTKRGEWWIVRFEDGHEGAFQTDEIATVKHE